MEMNKKGTSEKKIKILLLISILQHHTEKEKKSGKRMVNQHCLHGRSDPGQMAEGFTRSGADG